MTYWSVVQTLPSRERLACEQLRLLGYETYFPRIRFKKQGRWRTQLLFPSYGFLRIVDDRWWSARWAIGVIQLLSVGQKPGIVKDEIVNEIRAQEGKDGFVKLAKAAPKFTRGLAVRIVGGKLNGQLALFEGQTKHDRIKVLLQILGGFAVVELGQNDQVEPLDVAIP